MRNKGLVSDHVLAVIRDDLIRLGYEVEHGKKKNEIIERPVFFGENGLPLLQYRIDAYHQEWHCGLEVEAGRATMGNAIFRDLFQAAVMVGTHHLCLAVPINYKHNSGGKIKVSNDYDVTVAVADTLYSHSRVSMPYGLTVIGY